MPILETPPVTFMSAYRPIIFEVYQFAGGADVLENAVVELFFNGSLINTFYVKASTITEDVFPGIDQYNFCIDVSEKLQNVLGPFSSLPSAFSMDCPSTAVDNVEAVGEFYISVTYEIFDSLTNTIIDPGYGPDVSSNFWATNATRGNLESMYLQEFAAPFPTLSRYLTNSAKTVEVCKDDNIFLSVLVPPLSVFQINAFKVTLFDSLGVELGSRIHTINTTINETDVFSINAGINNGLVCQTVGQETPGFDYNDPAVACYVIEFGILGLGFAPLTESFKYILKDSCKCCERRKFRLHWLNYLGGVDSYTFCSIKQLRGKYKYITAQKAKSWDKSSLTPNDPTEAPIFKTSTEKEERWRVVSQDLTNEEAAWLSEMFESVHVYQEIENNILIPVIIETAEQQLADQKNKIKYELILRVSNCEPRHKI